MRIGGTDKLPEQHARQFDVIDEVALALRETDVFHPLALAPHALEFFGPLLARQNIGAHWCTLWAECITPYGVMHSAPGAFHDCQRRSPFDGPNETRCVEGAGRSRRATG